MQPTSSLTFTPSEDQTLRPARKANRSLIGNEKFTQAVLRQLQKPGIGTTLCEQAREIKADNFRLKNFPEQFKEFYSDLQERFFKGLPSYKYRRYLVDLVVRLAPTVATRQPATISPAEIFYDDEISMEGSESPPLLRDFKLYDPYLYQQIFNFLEAPGRSTAFREEAERVQRDNRMVNQSSAAYRSFYDSIKKQFFQDVSDEEAFPYFSYLVATLAPKEEPIATPWPASFLPSEANQPQFCFGGTLHLPPIQSVIGSDPSSLTHLAGHDDTIPLLTDVEMPSAPRPLIPMGMNGAPPPLIHVPMPSAPPSGLDLPMPSAPPPLIHMGMNGAPPPLMNLPMPSAPPPLIQMRIDPRPAPNALVDSSSDESSNSPEERTFAPSIPEAATTDSDGKDMDISEDPILDANTQLTKDPQDNLRTLLACHIMQLWPGSKNWKKPYSYTDNRLALLKQASEIVMEGKLLNTFSIVSEIRILLRHLEQRSSYTIEKPEDVKLAAALIQTLYNGKGHPHKRHKSCQFCS